MPQIAFLSGVAGARGSFRRYVFILILSVFVPMLAVAGFVIGIDPYYVFGAPSWKGVNAVRPFYEPHVIIAKPYQMRRLRPDAVALGSSRAEAGIDPRHPAWGTSSVFNFAMPSSTSYDTMLAFTHAQAVGRPLKRAVLGLDFFAFNFFMTRNQDQKEERFAGNGVKEFADFIEAELKNRRRDDATAKDRGQDQVFNEKLYLAVNGDVAQAIARKDFRSGLQHYELAGRAERRLGAFVPPDWDEQGYMQANPDVAYFTSLGNFLSGYHHYLVAGRAEGRLGGFVPPNWNEAAYLAVNPSARVHIALGDYHNGYVHYAGIGKSEGRTGGFPATNIFDRLQRRWPALNNARFQLAELWRMVFSTTAAYEAGATIFSQSAPRSFDDLGMRVWEDHDKELRVLGGPGPLIRIILLGGPWAPELTLPKQMYCFTNTETAMTMFDPFRFLVRRAYAEGTDLRLFLTPLHPIIRALFRGLDLSARYDFWMKELVRINEEEAARAGRPPLPLWDFSDPNSITKQRIPMPGDPTPLRYFWEASHYRKGMGDLILDRIFDYRDPAQPLPDDFGVRLSAANIDAHIANSNAKLTEWAAHDEFAVKLDEVARSPHKNSRQPEATCW